LIKREDIKGII
jgi:hypothetical protein